MAAYLPPGWPAGVHPPDSEEFEQTAVTWLLDVVPPDYRLHGVLRRHPYALAVLARHHIAACVRGAREGYRSARTELGGKLPPGGVEAVLEVYRAEGSRLVDTASAVDLIGRALRGEVFTPQLAGTQDSGRGPREPGTGGRDTKAERDAGERDAKAERDAKGERNGKTEQDLKPEKGAGDRDPKPEKGAGDRNARTEEAVEQGAGERDARAGKPRVEPGASEPGAKGRRDAGQREAKGQRGAKPSRAS